MVGELGGRVSVSPGHLVGTGKVSFAPKGARRGACESHKTLSALGRWFGFELEAIASSLIGSAGCKLFSLIWVLSSR